MYKQHLSTVTKAYQNFLKHFFLLGILCSTYHTKFIRGDSNDCGITDYSINKVFSWIVAVVGNLFFHISSFVSVRFFVSFFTHFVWWKYRSQSNSLRSYLNTCCCNNLSVALKLVLDLFNVLQIQLFCGLLSVRCCLIHIIFNIFSLFLTLTLKKKIYNKKFYFVEFFGIWNCLIFKIHGFIPQEVRKQWTQTAFKKDHSSKTRTRTRTFHNLRF